MTYMFYNQRPNKKLIAIFVIMQISADHYLWIMSKSSEIVEAALGSVTILICNFCNTAQGIQFPHVHKWLLMNQAF